LLALWGPQLGWRLNTSQIGGGYWIDPIVHGIQQLDFLGKRRGMTGMAFSERWSVRLFEKFKQRSQSSRSVPLNAPHIPVSWGELIDKITILEIKCARLQSESALQNVHKELDLLSSKISDDLGAREDIRRLKNNLLEVNNALWEIEDRIRQKEAGNEFDDVFIELARAVYKNNDKRARLKREINIMLHSELIEEKGYSSY
jgi:hypothetical protein